MAYAGCGFRHDFLMVYSGYQFSHGCFGLLILPITNQAGHLVGEDVMEWK